MGRGAAQALRAAMLAFVLGPVAFSDRSAAAASPFDVTGH